MHRVFYSFYFFFFHFPIYFFSFSHFFSILPDAPRIFFTARNIVIKPSGCELKHISDHTINFALFKKPIHKEKQTQTND